MIYSGSFLTYFIEKYIAYVLFTSSIGCYLSAAGGDYYTLFGMENCLDLAIRTEGIAGSVIPTIELAASPVRRENAPGCRE